MRQASKEEGAPPADGPSPSPSNRHERRLHRHIREIARPRSSFSASTHRADHSPDPAPVRKLSTSN